MEEKGINVRRLSITLCLVLVTALAVGGATYYVMGKNAKQVQIASEKSIQTLQSQVNSLKNERGKQETGKQEVIKWENNTLKTDKVPISKTYPIHKFQDPYTDISQVKIKAIYFSSKDKAARADWREQMESELNTTKQFVEEQFNNKISISYDIYPEVVYGNYDCPSYFNFYQCSSSDIPIGSKAQYRIEDDLNSLLYREGGKYYNEQFLKDDGKSYTIFGVFNFDSTGTTDVGGVLGNKFEVVVNPSHTNYQGAKVEDQMTIQLFLKAIGLPNEGTAGHTDGRICSQMKDGVRVDYPDILAIGSSDIDFTKAYIDDDLKAGMGI
ncbi:MAG: hypothetical protein M1355_03080 [Patescibacteria group bacterium]|nr:hypothetical protein [Patescibacteria group bacterium]